MESDFEDLKLHAKIYNTRAPKKRGVPGSINTRENKK
jgi:hypothetical protein